MDILIYKFVLSMLLGAFVGLERQMHDATDKNKKNYLGLRTFALITVFGTISGFIAIHNPLLFVFLSAGIVLLIICYYIFDSLNTKDYGMTTEITLFFMYVIGILIAHDIFPQQFIIGMTVILVLLLSQKERLSLYLKLIKREELQAFIRYAVIALVILPLLPNSAFSIGNLPYGKEILQSLHLPTALQSVEVVNPFQLWLVVALITGIDVGGYILERIYGNKKGWFLASFVGGFISSTATTQSLAQQSKVSKETNIFVVAAIAATLSSFFEHALIILPLQFMLFLRTLPILLLMGIMSFILIIIFNRKTKVVKETQTPARLPKKELFHLYPAIKFAMLFVFIKFVSSIALQLFGSNGFYLAIGLGAIPGMDASLVTIAQTVGKTITYQSALFAFIIANAVNLFVKCLLAFMDGKKSFAILFSISVVFILLTGFLGVLLQIILF